MTRALDGRDYCNRTYWAARERIAAETPEPKENPEDKPSRENPGYSPENLQNTGSSGKKFPQQPKFSFSTAGTFPRTPARPQTK